MTTFTYSWMNYDAKIAECKAKGEEVTPESLRAAAKVLEEKAKELDKPKLTAHQKRLLEIANKHEIDIIKFNDNGYSYVAKETMWGEEEGRVSNHVYKHKSIMFSNHKYNSSTSSYINYITILDEDDEVHTYLKWIAS